MLCGANIYIVKHNTKYMLEKIRTLAPIPRRGYESVRALLRKTHYALRADLETHVKDYQVGQEPSLDALIYPWPRTKSSRRWPFT